MEMIIDIIQWVLIIYLGFSTFYILFFGIAGLFPLPPYRYSTEKKLKFAVLIPGYKEDAVIVDVAQDALNQDYPSENYDVVVVADSFQPATLKQLRGLPVKLIEVSFEKSTKSKALNKAMDQLGDDYDVAIVLDADNLMKPDFITKVNAVMASGIKAVQGHRMAKNTNTNFAVLDAVSEEINNHIFRKGHRVIGLSSAIIGSGMAFHYKFFKTLMKEIKAIGGFDKEIELRMLSNGDVIEYLHHAHVLDEKVQKAEVFHKQRRRWLSAQLHYFSLDFMKSVKALLLHGNIDYFNKAIQFIQPPRVLLLGVLILISVLSVIFNTLFFTTIWLVITGLCILAFFFSIPGNFYTVRTLKALLTLPWGIVLMFLSLLRIKGANRSFLHTTHGDH